jgi:hypothetical protein
MTQYLNKPDTIDFSKKTTVCFQTPKKKLFTTFMETPEYSGKSVLLVISERGEDFYDSEKFFLSFLRLPYRLKGMARTFKSSFF